MIKQKCVLFILMTIMTINEYGVLELGGIFSPVDQNYDREMHLSGFLSLKTMGFSIF